MTWALKGPFILPWSRFSPQSTGPKGPGAWQWFMNAVKSLILNLTSTQEAVDRST